MRLQKILKDPMKDQFLPLFTPITDHFELNGKSLTASNSLKANCVINPRLCFLRAKVNIAAFRFAGWAQDIDPVVGWP